MLHRDISVNNIMWEEHEGKYYFRLIDFDNATIVTDSAAQESSYVASSRHRTGTLPFMAYELVMDAYLSATSYGKWNPIKHLLRHDWASLFFVSIWCGLTMVKDEDGVNDKALCQAAKSMETGVNLHAVADYKRTLCTPPVLEGPHSMVPLPSAARCLDRWFLGWRLILQDSLTACQTRNVTIGLGMQTEPFDLETAGGTITRDRLKSVLTPLMPFRQEEPDGWDEVFMSSTGNPVAPGIDFGPPVAFTGASAQDHKHPTTRVAKRGTRTQRKRVVKNSRATVVSKTIRDPPAVSEGQPQVLAQNKPPKKGAHVVPATQKKTTVKPIRQVITAADDIRSRLRVRKAVVYKE